MSTSSVVFEPLEELVLYFELTDVLSAATWAKLREAHHHFALRVSEVAIEHGATMTRVDMREKPHGVVETYRYNNAFVVGHALSELTRDVLGERDGDEGAVYDEACRDRVAEAVLEPTHEVAFRVGLVELPANHWLARDAALLGRAAAYVRASLGVRIVAVDIAAALASDVALRAQLALRGTVLWLRLASDGVDADAALRVFSEDPSEIWLPLDEAPRIVNGEIGAVVTIPKGTKYAVVMDVTKAERTLEIEGNVLDVVAVQGVPQVKELDFCGCRALVVRELPALQKLSARNSRFSVIDCPSLRVSDSTLRFKDNSFDLTAVPLDRDAECTKHLPFLDLPHSVISALPPLPHLAGRCSKQDVVELTASDLAMPPCDPRRDRFLARCVALVRVDLEPLRSATEIGKYFLAHCSSLRSVDLRPLCNVRSCGVRFLWSCTSLLRVDASPMVSLEEAPHYFCFECPSLRRAKPPSLSNAKNTGAFLFGYCSSLTAVDLMPLRGVTRVDGYFLTDCKRLVTIEHFDVLKQADSIDRNSFCIDVPAKVAKDKTGLRFKQHGYF